MAIEIVPLARDTAVFLTPFLPYLVKAGEKAAEKVGEKFSEGSWNLAKQLWHRLKPRLDEKEASREAAEDLAKHPEDEDAQAAFRLQLKKLLSSDEAFAAELQDLLTEIKAHPASTSYFQQAKGNYIAQAQYRSTATVSVNKPDDASP